MQRVINTVATLAAVAVLAAGLWQDWSLLTTLKRMLISYLGFFFLGSLGALVVKVGGLFEKKSSENEDMEPLEKDAPRKAGKKATPRAGNSSQAEQVTS